MCNFPRQVLCCSENVAISTVYALLATCQPPTDHACFMLQSTMTPLQMYAHESITLLPRQQRHAPLCVGLYKRERYAHRHPPFFFPNFLFNFRISFQFSFLFLFQFSTWKISISNSYVSMLFPFPVHFFRHFCPLFRHFCPLFRHFCPFSSILSIFLSFCQRPRSLATLPSHPQPCPDFSHRD